MSLITIDGSQGEGGGQVLRTSLALSLVTGRPFRIERIRAGRAKPGLMRQHLTAVRAAADVSRAEVAGAAIGSQALEFRPGRVAAGEYSFAVGTAGSATLVLQTVLPALMLADGPSALALEGGTHNPMAPPFEFLARAFVPLLARIGPRVALALERPGFYPAGGGRFTARIEPVPRGSLRRLDLPERGEVRAVRAVSLVANLPRDIARRELAVAAEALGLGREALAERAADQALGPGNAFWVEVESERVTEVFSAIGEKGVPAETVARGAAAEAKAYLDAGVPVGTHLADQILLPMALAGGGSFRTLAPSGHTKTQADVLARFLPVETEIRAAPGRAGAFDVVVRRLSS